MLLYGPPGTGKTLLARAVAHHTDCTFIRVSGSELVQKFIGEGELLFHLNTFIYLFFCCLNIHFLTPGARMVRELFVMAREHAPSIIFMDEIDSIGSSRLEGGSGGDSEVQRTMLELLNQLDGFEATKNIKVSDPVFKTRFFFPAVEIDSFQPNESTFPTKHHPYLSCFSGNLSIYFLHLK